VIISGGKLVIVVIYKSAKAQAFIVNS